MAGREQRLLRTGAVLYALLLIAAYVVPSAVGGNAARLGALLGGPVAALAAAPRRGHYDRRRLWLLAALAPFLVFWQINAPLADFRAVQDHPSVKASFYAPLLGELRRLDVGYGARPARIEIVPTAAHWEARWVAPHVMLARGWERQLDSERNGLFYERRARMPPNCTPGCSNRGSRWWR